MDVVRALPKTQDFLEIPVPEEEQEPMTLDNPPAPASETPRERKLRSMCNLRRTNHWNEVVMSLKGMFKATIEQSAMNTMGIESSLPRH